MPRNPIDPTHRAATLLTIAVHRLHEDWPQIESSETLRGLVRSAGGVLRGLDLDDPRVAGRQLANMDDLFTHIPNGDPS